MLTELLQCEGAKIALCLLKHKVMQCTDTLLSLPPCTWSAQVKTKAKAVIQKLRNELNASEANVKSLEEDLAAQYERASRAEVCVDQRPKHLHRGPDADHNAGRCEINRCDRHLPHQ